ncbi:MAG: serine hydrolase domain-containing protein [Nitrosomonas sp.]
MDFKKLRKILVSVTLLSTFGAYAQSVAVTDSIDQIVQKLMPTISDNTPGFSTIVVVDGKTIYKKMLGSADLENSIPIKENTLFNIGSTSKQFTAFLILLLEEEGKLSIDDNVNKYLPEYKVFQQNTIKIKHLLYHSSGLREELTMLQLCGWKDDDVYSNDDNKYLLTRQTNLNFSPGTMEQYSNTNYYVLALIIERITGKTFSEYCKEKIFVPLEMSTAIVVDNHQKIILNKAEAYNSIKEESRMKYTPSDDWYGHGGIYCSIEDLKKWADNFTLKKIGSPALYIKFFSKGAFDNGKIIQDYGYGLFHDNYKGIQNVWHDGARLGFRTSFVFYQEKNVYIITLSNARDFPYPALREKIADYIFKDQFPIDQEPKTNTIPSLNAISKTESQLKQYTGLYWDRIGDQTYKIHFNAGNLYADDYILVPEGENLFRLKNGEDITGSKMQFNKINGAAHWQMTLIRGRDVAFKSDNSFTHEWVDSTKNITLNEFGGYFYSEELDINFEVKSQIDYLELYIRGYDKPIKMQCVFKDYFSDPDFSGMNFQRDSKGKIAGFIFINMKANNILFKKFTF